MSTSPNITLVVKAPNQKISDQKIECTVDWTVRELKDHLSKVYPTNPSLGQQRIVYLGRLLTDDKKLQDVLKQCEPGQNVHTIHLICTASMSESTSTVPETSTDRHDVSSEGLRHRFPGENQPPNDSSSFRAFPNAGYQSYVHPGMMYYYTGMNAAAVPPMTPGGYAVPQYGFEQLQWMQQAYAQSMMQYMQQFQHVAAQPHLIPAPPVAPPVIPAAQPAHQNFPNEFPGAMMDPEPPVQPFGLNAGGGREAVDDEADLANRDWLDHVYKVVQYLMLTAILYFYSSPQRFLVTMAMALFVYLYRAGWLRRAPVENRNPAHQREPERRENAEAAADNAAAEQASENPEASATVVDLQATRRPSTFEVIWSVVSSFFTSLVPENPPPININ